MRQGRLRGAACWSAERRRRAKRCGATPPTPTPGSPRGIFSRFRSPPPWAGGAPPAGVGPLLDSALAVDPGFWLARLARADARRAQGDTSGARRDLDAARCEACAADMWPSWTAWHALALGSLGDTVAARVEADSGRARLHLP